MQRRASTARAMLHGLPVRVEPVPRPSEDPPNRTALIAALVVVVAVAAAIAVWVGATLLL
jgi:hypothetical protein